MESTGKRTHNKIKIKSKSKGDRISKGSFKLPIYSSSDLIGSNKDLLRQILIHVREKPLLRFKAVSKIWLNVISDPDFSIRWNKIRPPTASALFLRRDLSTWDEGTDKYLFIPLDGREQLSQSLSDSLPLECRFLFGSKCIQQSCNGLIHFELFVVYNPTTKQLRDVPRPPAGDYYSFQYINLIFDPLKSCHFKLLYVRDGKVFIYSSESNAWRVPSRDSLGNKRPNSDVIKFGVYLNGAIHWPSHRKGTSLYFDVDEECFRTMPMPPIQGGAQVRIIRYFGVLQGQLHMIDYEDDSSLNFDVFVMEKDYSNWFVKYNVNLAALSWRLNPVGCLIQRFYVLSLVEDEEQSSVLVMYVPYLEMVMSYNLKNEKLKKLCHLSLTPGDLDLLKRKSVHQFIRTTVEF
ncbi:hypothetical protein LguiA_025914 [Lonicera macranthoides]